MDQTSAYGVPLINTRTTFQRLSDARFFTGRVLRLRRNVLAVVCTDEQTFEPNERFAFHVYGAGSEALFFANYKTVAVSRDLLVPEQIFLIEGEIRLRGETQAPRFATVGLLADIDVPGLRKFEGARVSDISLDGLGLTSIAFVRKGSVVDITIHDRGEKIEATGTACYCVRPKNSTGQHRIGFHLDDFDRISASRWRRLYADVLDASRYQALTGEDQIAS